MVTVRYVIALAVSKEWSLYQMDVYNAFLQGDLDEEEYIKMPEGFQQKGNHKVCSLLKSLYGLKQASRQWNIKLTIALITVGCHQSAHDYSLFTLKKLIEMGLELKYVEWNNSFNSWELDLHREILDLYLLSQKWKELVEKAKAKQLQPDEYNSGTLTLSNLGMFGVDRFDVILPPGQGVIMAVGASRPSVVANVDGFFNVKNKMLLLPPFPVPLNQDLFQGASFLLIWVRENRFLIVQDNSNLSISTAILAGSDKVEQASGLTIFAKCGEVGFVLP
ncbi:hypothetical protein CQW23_16709 [Capsicum baccatum]|uniref:Reverse transcriptase Ty1/copia-type domain-containing protein n=1 Tax=Capsicum baccatum TaxID=33114 RepID=A0A2G2WBQ9_CAPBA|nr:hypothetical protein CQW23_16709 [Capsicum baccatum]